MGKATLLDDTEEVWKARFGRARPEFFQIYREFPYLVGDKDEPPAHGTVIRCEDPEWLAKHAHSVVAALYWLGDEYNRSEPAEMFTFLGWSMPTDPGTGSDGVSIRSKHGINIETPQSLRIYPPVETRGRSEYAIKLDSARAQALLKLFDDDPSDRRIVALSHYLRTHFNDPLITNPLADAAFHCAAIEAAIGTTKGMGGKEFACQLVQRYGEAAGERQFFRGLYAARSVYVHGHDPHSEAIQADSAINDYEYFMAARMRGRLLRALSRDAIMRCLAPTDSDWDRQTIAYAVGTLGKALGSDMVWQHVNRALNAKGAADTLASMSSSEVRSLSDALRGQFSWDCVRDIPSDNVVFKALVSCAIAFTRKCKPGSDVYAAIDALGKAAHVRDRKALELWTLHHDDAWHFNDLALRSQEECLVRIAVAVAKFFDPMRRM